MAKALTVLDFFKKYPDEETCLDHVMEVRFGKSLDCPKCGKKSTFYRIKKRPAYACEFCGHHLSPMAGTPFENTRTPLQMWFYAIYLFTTTRHGVSAKELQRQLGVTYKTAWRMGHEIRKYMGKVDGDDELDGHVEADESYVGGKPRYIGARKGGRSADGKTIVFGMVERAGNLMTKVIDNASRKTIEPIIAANIAKGATMSTDEWVAYDRLDRMGYTHGRVNHGTGEYVRGTIHTNTIEGFWSHFKCSVKGTHRAISKKHMAKYLGEFEFRFNLRHDTSDQMLDRLLKAF
jgi:transposase-like protein